MSTDCSILRINVHWLLSIALYCPLTAQYCVIPYTTAHYCGAISIDCSILRSTVNWLLSIAQYCPLNAQYCAILSTDYSIYCTVFRVNQTSTVQPFSITTRRSVVLPNNIIALYTWSCVTARPTAILTEFDLKPTSFKSTNAAVPKLNKLQMTSLGSCVKTTDCAEQ
jgi:hypothetical protein